ncbi:GlsB/YeaQ/YmgE family stress response membrane protein [Pyxidicoccus fallax]|uniref:GlsB/YeaQ/YmgE family stress response membrane protein n=1 Tax=Pyxidicoccus fallax TaxID=394095 RepID=A0A848L895_9BACT|nr:GlsB/YeaQ/YmgE family stress response membrane protein [Pyxidicoccus fallax]NMO15019.1 GlsB/YeaQ/YmgE family stress response membrane protein [Pyxidicoccus fallax]NPC82655.1 GlsB/YeaQ/YmgE family stress response membrane protein [Pyxidicoccus fallax]
MAAIVFIIVGWVVGLVARAILPGTRHMGLVSMLLIGMVGGIVGGMFAGTFNTGTSLFVVRPGNLVGSAIGALAAVLIVHVLNRSRAHA